jgi:predicted enzyme related to lactoylglutathione lyase
MARLDHLQLPVKDWRAARDWWRSNLGFAVEFEIPERNTVALKDDADLAVFFSEGTPVVGADLSFTIQVEDVEATFRALDAKGITFVHPPQKVFWGYGAELLDPNGYRLRLWDPASMKAKGGG